MKSVKRLFIDVNILFSAAYGSPGPVPLWEESKKGRCILLASRYVIEEARRNLNSPGQSERLDEYLKDVQVVPEADPTIGCPVALPQKDRPVLMSAIAARADVLITGDQAHFGKYFGKTFQGVQIMTLRAYIQSRD